MEHRAARAETNGLEVTELVQNTRWLSMDPFACVGTIKEANS